MADDESTTDDDQREADDDQNQDQDEQLHDAGKLALKRERDARKTAERKLADVETRLADFEKRDKAAADAKAKADGDYQKLLDERERENAELQRKLAERDLVDRKRVAAKSAGLPDTFAERLRGETDEDLVADATSLAEFVRTPNAERIDTGERSSRGENQEQDRKALSNPARWGLRT